LPAATSDSPDIEGSAIRPVSKTLIEVDRQVQIRVSTITQQMSDDLLDSLLQAATESLKKRAASDADTWVFVAIC
jgi:hypothetical protein